MLEAKGLACARGGLRILSGLSFRLNSGQALILRGPNGSGKTTLIRTLAGLQPPDDGTIEAPPESIAYAAHADGLKATLSVAENLSFWASVFGTSEIGPALEAFRLSELASRPAQNLSAGQKRRLALARLSVTGRPIWLLDEPTVSLDAESVTLFAGIVKAHLANGGAALIATHIDLGFEADTLDLTPFRARPGDVTSNPFDEAFL